MNVDWAIAVSVFLVFIGIGMAYYWGLFETDSNAIGLSLDDMNGKVLDFLMVDSWTAPIRYNSPDQRDLAVLYFDFPWPEGTKNSARVLDSGLLLSCMFQGDRLYFETSLDAGDNEFLLTFANVSVPLACDSVLDASSADAALPLASERYMLVSQSRIDQLLASEYNQFRHSLGMTRNLRIEIDSGTTSAFGPVPPQYTNTYVRETRSLIQETGQPVTVRSLVW